MLSSCSSFFKFMLLNIMSSMRHTVSAKVIKYHDLFQIRNLFYTKHNSKNVFVNKRQMINSMNVEGVHMIIVKIVLYF